MSEPRLRMVTMQQAVLSDLRNRILSGELRPGSAIRPDAVAADLGTSRVPVREALKILEGEGQVVYRPHYGYTVTELRLSDLKEIYRMRQLLETEAVRAAVPKLGEEELERIAAAMEEMEALTEEEIVLMTAANRRFHFTLLEAADMPKLQHFIRLLWDSSDPYRSLYYMEKANRDLVNREHREIHRTLTQRDADAAVRLLDQHRDHAITKLARILAE